SMKLGHVYSTVVTLTLAAILFGAVRSDLPLLQYLGNTTGVLLGFVLGVWWTESEKRRARKERVELFWTEFRAFVPTFENQVQAQIAMTCNAVFDSVIEYRLPLPEVEGFRKRADELE